MTHLEGQFKHWRTMVRDYEKHLKTVALHQRHCKVCAILIRETFWQKTAKIGCLIDKPSRGNDCGVPILLNYKTKYIYNWNVMIKLYSISKNCPAKCFFPTQVRSSVERFY